MQINSDLAGQQLSAIVHGSSGPGVSNANTESTPVSSEVPPLPRAENSAFHMAREQGQEKEYLQKEVDTVNEMVSEIQAPLNFSVEITDNGDYYVRILDEAGKEVKVIPSEEFVQTRDRIHAEIKGLIEDSQT